MSVLALPATVTEHRPRYEGANIRTWIGFKHFMYLVEEAVLDWLRAYTPGARGLYLDCGLGVEIVDCSVQLPATLEVDDLVRARVTATHPGRFAVTLHAVRDGAEVLVLRGKVAIALVRETDSPGGGPIAVGAELLPEPTPELRLAAPPGPVGGFGWSWPAPYYYCHFSDRVQHSGYVRVLEEAVDRYLAHRGISVGRLVRERGWIPVVSRARVRLLAAAHMEEVVHTTFTVEDVLRDTLFDGRMDSYVERGGERIHVATASILHGYAISRGPDAGRPATLDTEVIDALLGSDAP
ncbi:acyl-CoA thioesterase [Plantactinospora sp. WMMC1484]|uniref:acyl-CoA thioesterase n=1 Tax=Plantactinospora sp. WMMC1484 TaxID=3404122 RepID=UPI003BF6176E